jgi:putative N-acetylmannosamine-6-phosphate epimerase
MAEDQKLQMSEEIVQSPPAPVSDVMADCQSMPTCCQHHGMNVISLFCIGYTSQEVAIDTSF